MALSKETTKSSDLSSTLVASSPSTHSCKAVIEKCHGKEIFKGRPASSHASVVTEDDTDPSEEVAARIGAEERLENPLSGLSPGELAGYGERYAREHALCSREDVRAFRLGAQVAARQTKYQSVGGLTAKEIDMMDREETHPWSLPKLVTRQIVIKSLCAIIQGMDETVVNGAQAFYKTQFDIGSPESVRDAWLLGLTNAAPYIVCALLGCWLTAPMNSWWGRRGTLFICCLISITACVCQGFCTDTWWKMFICRCFLGLSIGPKSATTPMYAAECSPPKIRGALVMGWQLSTALGIMLGYLMALAFFKVPDSLGIVGLNWRLMMVSPAIPALIVTLCIYSCAESPRWLLSKGRHKAAYKSLCRLRLTKVQAARDLIYMKALIDAEHEIVQQEKHVHSKPYYNRRPRRNTLGEIFTTRRNRNAMIASQILMVIQQACGINVIAYYSSEIFLTAGFSEIAALSSSLGFGAVNLVFGIPGFINIDKCGRRFLLLTSLPLMALFMSFTGLCFLIPKGPGQIVAIALGIYLFGMAYSPGAGPVPFTYSAEAYPLHIRAVGMSLATATTWFFNALLALTWPSLLTGMGPTAAFSSYAFWNVLGWIMVLLFVPETKKKTLEELDAVFSVSLRSMARYGILQARWFVSRHILRRNYAKKPLVPIARYLDAMPEEDISGHDAV